MTPEQAVAAVKKAGHLVIVHNGAIFFNSYDKAEAERWEAKGALIVPYYSEDELRLRRHKGKSTTMGWEVHFLGACERIEIADIDGELVDLTRDYLLAAARGKVTV